jgi:SAM-dependent methyltransferase
MNDLEKYFRENNRRMIHKWIHYFDIYDRHFSRFRNKEIVILEIGVFQGGSLQMWKDYFGAGAKIYGIDIEPRCKELEEENITIFTGSQSDRKFLREVKSKIPPVDILIDDGGHTMQQQIVTFEELFDHVKEDGVYLCEDLHTSYWLKYGGGYKRRGTFIEYSKNFIDFLHAYHSEQRSLEVTGFTRSAGSVHYYDSIVVIEKQRREKPLHEKRGSLSFPETGQDIGKEENFMVRNKRKVYSLINRVLRFYRLRSIIWK